MKKPFTRQRTTPLPPVESSRLVTLSDGRPGLRGGMHVEIREPAPADSQPSTPHPSATLDFIASDETLDRYDEIVSASGWKLDTCHRNPVFQNAHKYGDIIFTLGRALITEIRTGSSTQGSFLFQRIEFAVDVNPMAKIAYGLYRGKFLNAVSVGFIPLKWENGDGTSSRLIGECPSSGTATSELIAGSVATAVSRSGTPHTAAAEDGRAPQFRRRYLEQELLEVSAVGIPANPNALALGLKSGAIEKFDLRDMSELIRQALAAERGLSSPQQFPNAQHLLKLSRTLRDLLRRI